MYQRFVRNIFSSCPLHSLGEKKNQELIQSALKRTSLISFSNKKLLLEVPDWIFWNQWWNCWEKCLDTNGTQIQCSISLPCLAGNICSYHFQLVQSLKCKYGMRVIECLKRGLNSCFVQCPLSKCRWKYLWLNFSNFAGKTTSLSSITST